MKKTSGWIVVNGYCAMRIIEGTDPSKVENRVAFIEKTPRVREKPMPLCLDWLHDGENWISGPKGEGGCIETEGETIYGFYPPSRAWCDEQLIAMGYELGDKEEEPYNE